MEIGFIGLGSMGRLMAENLRRAGHTLRVHDVRADAAASLMSEGAVWAPSPAQAAANAVVVFTCLPGPPEVDHVALSESGLLAAMQPGTVWFDLTTNAPERIRFLSQKFAICGVDVLDAPISGGPKGAKSRQLAFWVGGDKSVFAKYEALLRAMGDAPMHVGPIGSGCIVKLVHNSASFAVQSTLVEAFTLGVKAGLDPLVLFSALREGTTGRSRTFDRLAEQFLPGVYDPAAFSLRLAFKDMKLAAALADTYDVPMRMIGIATEDMSEAMHRGWGDRDARIALSLQSERAGVSVHVPHDRLMTELPLSTRQSLSRLNTPKAE